MIMKYLSTWSSLLIGLVSVCCISLAHSSTPVGSVLTVKGIVTLLPENGEAYFLDKNSAVYEGDTIVSTKKSFAVVSFVDETKIVVKQNTCLLYTSPSPRDS